MLLLSALLSAPAVIAAVIVIAIAGSAERWRLRGTGPVLVLQKFTINESENGEPLVLLQGRASGLMSFLLTAAGLSSETTLKITAHDIFLERASLFGFRAQYMPMHEVASTQCGYFRSLALLAASLGTYALGFVWFLIRLLDTPYDYQRLAAYQDVWPFLLGSAVVGTFFYVGYALSKRVVMSVQTGEDVRLGISFKRGVVDTEPIDLSKALRALNLLNRHVLLTAEPR